MTNLIFLTSYAFPFWVLVGLLEGEMFLLMPVINLFLLHPIVDSLITHYFPNAKKKNYFNLDGRMNSFSYGLMMLYPVVQFIILTLCLVKASQLPITSSYFWLVALATGVMTGGAGLVMAHELMHGRSQIKRNAALFLTLMCSYSHWVIEHIFGHHKNVGTKEDPATSRKNESLYFFVVRSATMQVKSAFNLKQKDFIKYWSMQIAIYGLVVALFGAKGLVLFTAQSLIAIFLLEHVNYIEHYGLERKKNEKVTPKHSWDCYSFLTNVSMFNLGFHADHHSHINKDYRHLESMHESKVMPYGITIQMLVAMVPGLWFKMMNPLLEKSATSEKYFNESLIPELSTNVFLEKYDHLKNQVINQNLFRYLKFTQMLETEVINGFFKDLIVKQYDHPLMSHFSLESAHDFLERGCKIHEEEEQHAAEVTGLLDIVQVRSQQKSQTLEKPASLTYLLNQLEEITDEREKCLNLFSFVYVSETLISQKLSVLATDKNLYQPISSFMLHHLKDEVKHSHYFGEFMLELWPTLGADEQDYLQDHINQYKALFLQPDVESIRHELTKLGVEREDVIEIVEAVRIKSFDMNFANETIASDRFMDLAIKQAQESQKNVSYISIA